MSLGWVKVGMEVAEWTPGRGSGHDGQVVFTTVTKIGKRDVVLANGTRYNINHDSRSTGHRSPTWYLRRPDDPDVTRTVARIKRGQAVWSIEKSLKDWEGSGDEKALRTIISILSAFLPEEGKRVDRN